MTASLKILLERLDLEKIEIAPYNDRYPQLFEELRGEIWGLVPANLFRRIEHFGSTAVPGLAAKPIIDILIEVESVAVAHQLLPAIFERAGADFVWRPTTGTRNGDPWYPWIIMRHADGSRRAHLHIVEAGFPHWERLLFRDWLRTHPDAARAYEILKYDGAALHAHDREAYTASKGEFIRRVTLEAIDHAAMIP